MLKTRCCDVYALATTRIENELHNKRLMKMGLIAGLVKLKSQSHAVNEWWQGVVLHDIPGSTDAPHFA